MKRRDFVKTAVAAPAILRAAGRPLNLLFIMSDQHQREASGCYGSKEVRTPHIDEIAANGVLRS